MIKRIDKSLKSSHLFLGFPSFLHNSAPTPYLGSCLEDGGRDYTSPELMIPGTGASPISTC